MVANLSWARTRENYLVRIKLLSEDFVSPNAWVYFCFILFMFISFRTEGKNIPNILHFIAVANHIMHSLLTYTGEENDILEYRKLLQMSMKHRCVRSEWSLYFSLHLLILFYSSMQDSLNLFPRKRKWHVKQFQRWFEFEILSL